MTIGRLFAEVKIKEFRKHPRRSLFQKVAVLGREDYWDEEDR